MKTNIYKLANIGFLSLFLFANCSDDNDGFGHLKMDVPAIDKFELSDSEKQTNIAVNDWGIEYFKSIVENSEQFFSDDAANDGNIAVSPLSVSIALTLLANTGDEATEKAILEILGEPDLLSLNTTINKVMRYIPSDKNKSTALAANAVWYNNQLMPSDEWKNNMNSNFYSLICPLDFLDEDGSLNTINNWCYANTNGMIPRMVDHLDPALKMVLMNAIYFAGEWVYQFNKSKTAPATFYGQARNSDVDMMNLTDDLRYKKYDGFQAVSLPFKGNWGMVLLLPDENMNIRRIINGIDTSVTEGNYPYTILRIIDGEEVECEYSVELSLPKFGVSTTSNLTSSLESLGVPSFTKLSKMGLEDYASLKILQKTATFVDEEGAKVAAVTADIKNVAVLSPPKVTVEMNFIRPFIYFIRNDKTGSILMAGVINNL